MSAVSSSRIVMSGIEAPVPKRGMPPGEVAPDGQPSSRPFVVGRVEALDFLGLSDDDTKSFLGFNFAYYREAEVRACHASRVHPGN